MSRSSSMDFCSGPVRGILRAAPYDAQTRIGPPIAYERVQRGEDSPGATFVVTYNGFPDAAKAAFQTAVDIWASLVTSTVDIRVEASWTSLPDGLLGSAAPTVFVKNDPSLPRDFYFPIALANKSAGRDLTPNGSHIVASFNSGRRDWYFGTDGSPPRSQYDLVTVALHELCHGLGFLRSFDVDTSDPAHKTGRWGFQSDPSVLVWTDLFVAYGEDTPVRYLVRDFDNGSEGLYRALTSRNVFQVSSAGEAANGGRRPKLYAPSILEPGSSISHLDPGSFPSGNPNSLMTPFLGTAEAIHQPGPVMLGILKTYGWSDATLLDTLAEEFRPRRLGPCARL